MAVTWMVASAGCHEGAGVTAPVSWGSAVVASQWLVVQCQVSSAWLVRVMMAVAPVPAGGALPRRVQPVQAYWVPSAGGGGVMVLVMVALGGCRVMPGGGVGVPWGVVCTRRTRVVLATRGEW